MTPSVKTSSRPQRCEQLNKRPECQLIMARHTFECLAEWSGSGGMPARNPTKATAAAAAAAARRPHLTSRKQRQSLTPPIQLTALLSLPPFTVTGRGKRRALIGRRAASGERDLSQWRPGDNRISLRGRVSSTGLVYFYTTSMIQLATVRLIDTALL